MRAIPFVMAGVVLTAVAVIQPDSPGPNSDTTATAAPRSFRSHGVRIVGSDVLVPPVPLYTVLAPFESGLVPGIPPS